MQSSFKRSFCLTSKQSIKCSFPLHFCNRSSSHLVCVFFFPVFSANFRTCDILRMHAMCHIKDSHSFSCTLCTHTRTHKRTNTNRRCELCCLLSPGLVHTRIPLAGATSRSPQSTTHTHTQHQLCAHSRYLALTSALSCSSLSSRLRHLIPYRRTLDALHVLHAIQVAATGNSSLA